MEIATRRWIETAKLFVLLLFVLLLCSCDSNESPAPEILKSVPRDSVMVMTLQSSEFENGARLDAKYTVEGADISPPLAWSKAPTGTMSFALICEDPDAPSPRKPAAEPWVHWIIFNISNEHSELPPRMGRELEPPALPGARQGKNSWPDDNVGYRGPAPPPGSGTHRYFFKLYALDTMLDLAAGATKRQLLDAMSGHVLAQGELIGTYHR
jgi:Raf kinase inhibitor-like YbhB/YbcL family protein